MKNAVRVVSASAAAATALVLTGPASAAYTSARLVIENASERTSGGGPLTIAVSTSRTDDPTARFVIYIPHGYVARLTPPVGQQIGTVTARASSLADPNIIIPLRGVLRADNPANYAATAIACLGLAAPPPQSVWLILLESPTGGNPIPLPAFVSRTAGAEATFAQAKITICLPPPAQGQTGAKVFEARLTLRDVFTNPAAAGRYTWRAIFTPFATNAGPVNPTGTVEAQAIDVLPARLVVRPGRYNKRTKRLVVSGTITEGDATLRTFVRIYLNGRPVARVRSNESGVYRVSLRIPRKGRYALRAQATVPVRTIGGACTPTMSPIPCLRATTDGFTASSASVRVRVR